MSGSFLGETLLGVVANLRKIIAFCFVIAIVSTLWMFSRTQRWEASAIAMVPGVQSTSISGLSGIGAAGLPEGLGDIADQFARIQGTPGGVDITVAQQVLSSRKVMERLILRYDLITRFRAVSMERAREKLKQRVSIFLSPEGFFVISAQGRTREEAASMVMDIIRFANEELSTLVTSRARRSRIEAEKSLAAALDSLGAAQLRMEAFRSATGLSFPEQQGIAAIEVFTTIETELALVEAELAGFAGNVTTLNPAYRQALQTAEYLRSLLEGRLTTGDSLSVFPGMASFPAYLREYENLYMELETQRTLYLLLRQELETLKLEEVRDSPTLEIIVPPSPEFLRVFPKRGRTVIIFTFLAFIVAVLWIMVLTYVRRLMSNDSTGPFWKEVIRRTRLQLSLRRRSRSTGTKGS